MGGGWGGGEGELKCLSYINLCHWSYLMGGEWEGGGKERGNSSVKVIQTCATGAISWEAGEERGNSSVKAI